MLIDWPLVLAVTTASLDIAAAIAAIVTGVVAVLFYRQRSQAKDRRREKLEAYLLEAKRMGDSRGRHTAMHLMAALRMSEAEIMEAAFTSDLIDATPGNDVVTGRAACIYLEHAFEPKVRPGRARF